MAKNFKRLFAAILVFVMLTSLAPHVLAAEESATWRGNDMLVNVVPSGNEYSYMIVADKDNGSVQKNFYYYETSNHTVKKEATSGGAIHLIPIVDTNRVSGAWTPDGLYTPGVSNYDVVYCCDAATSSEAGIYYKRLNLEDSEYYSVEQAEKLRAILANSYPYVSVEETKAYLETVGFEQAKELDKSEIVSAVQAAIWSIANKGIGDSYVYNKTATTTQKLSWGGYMNDFVPENFDPSGKGYNTFAEDIGNRINALKSFLLSLEPVKATDGQIVITGINIVDSKLFGSEDKYNVDINVELNQGADANDTVVIKVFVGETLVETAKVGEAKNYSFSVEAVENDNIKVVVSGTQNLEKGVYFYAPKPADVNGDGIATSREVSQNLIGVASGETPVYAEASLRLKNVTFKSGEVSNISYMFIDKATGEVEFVKKVDIEDGATSAPIVTMDGYVSAMFMKQGTSGMFWFSEEVDDDIVNTTINCLATNNPSYKGYNAVAFGKGAHQLEFKRGKFVTYNFGGDSVVIGGSKPADEKEPVVDEPVVDEPVAPATLNVAVNGGSVTSWTVYNGVTAVYIAANGKVPDAIWVSETVGTDIMNAIIAELGANSGAEVLVGAGSHTIEYKQNKNHTKSVTYDFQYIE